MDIHYVRGTCIVSQRVFIASGSAGSACDFPGPNPKLTATIHKL